MEKPQIIKVLEDAVLAYEAGDFVNSLKFFEHFFDHALDDDPYAFYGVRLDHCLRGWGDLAMVFPGAKQRLEAKKREVFDDYQQHRVPERFHDYLAICRVLGIESEALNSFLELHHNEPKSAAKLVKYIWEDLVNAEQWQVCSDVVEQPNQKMDELFAVFDEAAKLKEFDPSFDNIRFENHIVDKLLNDVQTLAIILRHNDRTDEIGALERQFQQGVESRDHSILSKQFHAKSAFLFSGH